MPPRRNPAIFAAPRALQQPVEEMALLPHIFRHNPGLQWVLAQVGIDRPQLLLDEWLEHFTSTEIGLLATTHPHPRHVAEMWSRHSPLRLHRNILELLVFENAIGRIPVEFSQALNSTTPIARAITNLYWQLGLGFYEHAKSTGWSRPFVVVRALQLCSRYLHTVLDSTDDSDDRRAEILGRLSVATVLMGRMSDVAQIELLEAEAQLVGSIELGNTHPSAKEYLAELWLRLFDKTADRKYLIKVVLDSTTKTSSMALSQAEAYLHLAGLPETSPSAARQFGDRSRSILEAIGEARGDLHHDQITKYLILTSCARFSVDVGPRASASFLQSAKVPFGAYRKIREANLEDIELQSLISEVIDSLDRPETDVWLPLTRRVFADCCRARADALGPEAKEMLFYLNKSIGAHRPGPNHKPLLDEGSRLHLGNDLLTLAAITGTINPRIRGFNTLLESAVESKTSASPFALMGANLELFGGLRSAHWARDAQAPWIEAIKSGDFGALYSVAAQRALTSTDLTRSYLGSRNSVLTVDDHLELASGVFIFKGTTKVNQAREAGRLQTLKLRIDGLELADQFEVPELIGEVSLSSVDQTFGLQTELVSMQRFKDGESLEQLFTRSQSDLNPTKDLLLRCVEYLALIHSTQGFADAGSGSTRRQLLTKEVGVWLRNLIGTETAKTEFESWWHLAMPLKSFPKRDAHPGNWICTGDGRVTAVDFESAGNRPIGYELAQLTDDEPGISVDVQGWEFREKVILTYVEKLRAYGSPVDPDEVQLGYQLGLLARATRAMTLPSQSATHLHHGAEVVRYLQTSSFDGISRIATSWYAQLGARMANLSVGRSIAISKTLAYILRHDSDLSRDQEGWANVDAVLARARQVGRPVSSAELRMVSTLARERRFELVGTRIRARYGHTVEVSPSDDVPETHPKLFHATSVLALKNVLSRREGLKPMKRQQVHLTEDPASAMVAGGRHRAAILFAIEAGINRIRLTKASEQTWLAPSIPSEMLKIVGTVEQLSTGLIPFRA